MNDHRVRILLVCGARPNFMKVAPVMAAVEAWNAQGRPATTAGPSGAPIRFSQTLAHTGQHYDAGLSDVLCRQLGPPQPDHHLGVGSGSHAAQTAHVLERLEPVLLQERPDLVIVGDVNSTLAAVRCAAKSRPRRCRRRCPHVELGQRARRLAGRHTEPRHVTTHAPH